VLTDDDGSALAGLDAFGDDEGAPGEEFGIDVEDDVVGGPFVGFEDFSGARIGRQQGLVEAADGKIGNMVDRVLLYCFHYDPETGKYGAAVMRLVRAGAILILAAIAGFLIVSLRREKKHIAVVGN